MMTPPTGERALRFVGDRIRFALRPPSDLPNPSGWRAFLRTNLGRAARLREEILATHTGRPFLHGASWRDVPMRWDQGEWTVEFALTEVGFFKAKAYALDPRGWQVWPEGPDFSLTVHPDAYRTRNTIYCAFARMFGPGKTASATLDEGWEARLKALDKQGYTVIPPSGTLRDLADELPHIFDALGCHILHLLPVNPTPTTGVRLGRFGSPYAGLDLTGIDPALIEPDRRTTGVEQFRELAYQVHARGGRLFLDLVVNHTGWHSTLFENHPDWFLRDAAGQFVSPGAWGVTWEDVVELSFGDPGLWEYLAEVFLTWCRRGVDGFRCDAGYKVPTPVWQYITARVREEFPDTIFLLEGLGGGWADTERLLSEGGMQWAYSELFQEWSGLQVAGYLDHALKQSQRVGVLVHYSETHDNDRLAQRGRAWSLLRNRLCALASVSGAYGFTCGVEWLAAEKINVHSSRGLAWGSPDNLVGELARLNHLLADHPCFFDGAKLTRLSAMESPVYALRRDSAEGKDHLLVLVNTDPEKSQTVTLDEERLGRAEFGLAADLPVAAWIDLLGQPNPRTERSTGGRITFTLQPAAAHCLGLAARPRGLAGEAYRRARAQAAWALSALSYAWPVERIPDSPWRGLARLAEDSPARFLAAVSVLKDAFARGSQSATEFVESGDPPLELARLVRAPVYPRVVTWTPADRTRILPVPPEHWLLLQDCAPFRATLHGAGDGRVQHVESIPAREGHIASFRPGQTPGDARLWVERYTAADQHVEARLRFLASSPQAAVRTPLPDDVVLLTNGRGGMARLCVDLGRVTSKYDCLLGANLHPNLPVERHVLAKRVRVWANAGGFISPLNYVNLLSCSAGPQPCWRFLANAGDGRAALIQMTATMPPDQNTVLLRFLRCDEPTDDVSLLPNECPVRLTVRVDLEDRNFHHETHRNPAADRHFTAHTRALDDAPGFLFQPAPDRRLRVAASAGAYHSQPEWSERIPHPIEASRGQVASGDAYSPGWLDLPLQINEPVTLVVTAEPHLAAEPPVAPAPPARADRPFPVPPQLRATEADPFDFALVQAARAFLVRRGQGSTIIAGYPWFLDWGRDALISARGLLAAGMTEEVERLIVTFARFEQQGTLPNALHGGDASNRDTSDAPLWFALVCEELAGALRASAAAGERLAPHAADRTPPGFYATVVDSHGRTLADVLRSIGVHYLRGTPNGIRMDPASALIWSPSHFTWMDTNFPAGTPREGYPVEIQALWIRLLRHLDRLGVPDEGESWGALAERAAGELHRLFWLEEQGWFADALLAKAGVPAARAQPDRSLRGNFLFLVSLGLATGERAQRAVDAALRYLLVPGALRSLAPLPVDPPLPIRAPDGRLLNNPAAPYWGRYEGDEDTRRKPAYHNGTAWVWVLPTFCEALARAWDCSPEAVAAARAYLGSLDRLLATGCLGQLPEILDGDAPHTQRGCDAQAWSVTEALRVWRWLQRLNSLPARDQSLPEPPAPG